MNIMNIFPIKLDKREEPVKHKKGKVYLEITTRDSMRTTYSIEQPKTAPVPKVFVDFIEWFHAEIPHTFVIKDSTGKERGITRDYVLAYELRVE